MIRASKRSRSDQPPPSSKSTIDDLPDPVLVDILCRLPDNRVVFQCKLVSKRWRTHLSDPCFISLFLRIQQDQQKPFLNRYVMIPDRLANRKTLVLTMSSEPPPPSPHPLETTQTSIFSVIPCLESNYYADQGHHLTVEGTYNDLLLCSQGTFRRRVYYICNCYTKEWIRLTPPTPPKRLDDRITTGFSYDDLYCNDIITTGFICEPYYKVKADCSSSNSSIIKLHAEYRCRVVRLITTYVVSDKDELELVYRSFVEIFSSETGKWREYSLSRRVVNQKEDCLLFRLSPFRLILGRGIACNGKLYWLIHGGSIFELDPFNLCSTRDGDVIDQCCFIDSPAAYIRTENWHIGVCRGRLQMCRDFFDYYRDPMAIWELKENEVDGKPEWCLLHRLTSLSEMVPTLPFTISIFQPFRIVGFHPDHGHLVYLQHEDKDSGLTHIVMCNVREKTLQIGTEFPSESSGQIFSYVIPLWPTPVPTRLHFQVEYLNITVIGTGVDSFTLKVDSLTTVKQLIKELEGKKVYQQYVHELRFDGRVLDHDDDNWLTEYGIKDNSHITLKRVYYNSSSRCSLEFSNKYC